MVAVRAVKDITIEHKTTMQPANLYLFHETAQDILEEWKEAGCVVLLKVAEDKVVLTIWIEISAVGSKPWAVLGVIRLYDKIPVSKSTIMRA
jgi:hypothetical protein